MWRVLLTDDNPVGRLMVKRLSTWKEMGFYIADEASNGREALEKLNYNSYDLLITDIKMPVMTGLDLLKEVTSLNLVPFTVILSEFNEFNFAKQALVHNAFDYLVKPVDEITLKDLLERVDHHLKKLPHSEKDILCHYSKEDIQLIINAIKNKNLNYLTISLKLMYDLYLLLNKDLIKTTYIMKNVLIDIVNGIVSECSWLQLFWMNSPIQLLKNMVFERYEELELKIKNILSFIVEPFFSFCLGECGSLTEKICLYIIENLDKKISLNTISNYFFTNASYLSNHFKSNTGLTITQYITNVKIERAKCLLALGASKTYEVAQQLGFEDDNYFSRLFKKTVGITPTDFLKVMHNID